MWTQDTAQGKVRYFERGVVNGRQLVVSVTLNDRRKSTQKEAAEILRQKLGAAAPAPETVTFGAMLKLYKQSLAKEMKPQTARIAEFQFRKIEQLIGSETLLTALSAPFVRERLWADDPRTYNERLKHFKAALRWAYRDELIADVNFLDRLPKMRSEAHREALTAKYLEADELKVLLDGMKTEKWRLLTEFLVLSGLRIGEAMALTQKDVDLTARTITVNKTYSQPLKAVSMSAKTDAGNRIVAIQDELLDCIHRINKIMPRRRKIFFDDGGYISYEAYSKYFRENTERLIGRKLSVHSLRHTHVALLAASGLSYDMISRRCGHAHSDITRDIYMHVTKKLQERDADQIKTVKIL